MNLLTFSRKLQPSLLAKSDLHKLIRQVGHQTRQWNTNEPDTSNDPEQPNRAPPYRRNYNQANGPTHHSRNESNYWSKPSSYPPNPAPYSSTQRHNQHNHQNRYQSGGFERSRNRRDNEFAEINDRRGYARQSDGQTAGLNQRRNQRYNDEFTEIGDHRQYGRQSDGRQSDDRSGRFDHRRSFPDGQTAGLTEYRANQFDASERPQENNDGEDESIAENRDFDYKKYKSLNHQQNELRNMPRPKFRSADNYQKFAKDSKHLKAKHEEEASFGELAAKEGKKAWLDSEFLEEDPDHMERMEVVTEKRPRNYYLFEIKKAVYEDKHLGVQRALELYREMRLDRKLVDSDFFKMLIKGCALVGHVKKAFELFEDYKAIQPPQINRSIVTSLFNCCANSPDKQLAIAKAKELYDDLRLQGYNFNDYNYNCLIRTFGLLGDLETSFAFLDTMVENRFRLTVDTFNNLLTAACSNKEQGLSLATNIMQAMRFLYIRPDIQTYNLLYRIVRDCQFGSKQDLDDQMKNFRFPDAISSEFLRRVLVKQRELLRANYTKQMKKRDYQLKQNELANPGSANKLAVQEPANRQLMCLNFLGSNVGSITNQLQVVEIDYESLSKPENRLKLIGGLDFLFSYMYKDQVQPNIKTVSLITAIIENTADEERKLLNFIEDARIKMDTDFCNMLIRRANGRGDFDTAKSYLRLMTSKGLKPNIQTYGVMALACFTKTEISEFLGDMDAYGVRPNSVIMNQLIRNCTTKSKFAEIAYLIKCLNKYGVKPTTAMTEQLAFADEMAQNYLKTYTAEELKTKPRAIHLNTSYLKFKKSMVDYLSAYQKIEDESNVLEQFETEELPRNEEYHRFKVQMTHALREKRRFLAEMQAKEG